MHIVKATDPIAVPHPVFMVIGQPGICKTSLSFSMKDPLLLDFDLGVHRAVNRRDSLPCPTWSVVDELLANPKALDPYQSLIVDTAGRCLDVLTADIAIKDPKKAPGGNLSQQGWGVLKTRFRQFVSTVRALEKNLLILAHDKEEKDGDVKSVRADIVGGSYGEVMKNADFVGYLYMVGKDRILDFNPTDRWTGKNPAGWEPFKVPSVTKAATFFEDIYAKGAEALGKISEASAGVAQSVDVWRAQIATFTTADECNTAIPEIRKLSAILQPQVAKILLDHAASKGIGFDKPKKLFFPPQSSTPGKAESELFESFA